MGAYEPFSKISWQLTNKTRNNIMRDLVPLIIFFSIFFKGLILRMLASQNLLQEYSDQRLNIIFNTRGSWSLNKNMFNEKGKRYYVTSNSFGILWVGYIIILVALNSF
jgi:hypothetical protein